MSPGHRFAPAGAGIIVTIAFATGCAPRNLNTYRLDGAVLVPPGVIGPQLQERNFIADVPAGTGACPPDGNGAVRAKRHGKRIAINVVRERLVKHEAGWLSAWSRQAEADGCIAPGRAQDLALAIVESVPLPPSAAIRLLSTGGLRSGYSELRPGMRLQVLSPILANPSASPDAEPEIANVTGSGGRLDVDLKASNIIGVETAWYEVLRRTSAPGYRLQPLSAERNIQGKVEQRSGPDTNYFEFPSEATFFRLCYKSDANGVLAMVLFGPTDSQLDRETPELVADPSKCAQRPATCRVLPRRVGVNLVSMVKVNGKDLAVPWGAEVSAALRAAGVKNPDSILPQLRVTKLYRDQPRPVIFDAASKDILRLPLTGREEISF